MKTKFLRHAAFALLIAAIGLLAPSSPLVASGFGGFDPSDFKFEMPDFSGMIPAPHADLTACAVKAISLDVEATNYNLVLKVDCGGEKTVTVMAKSETRLKMAYSQALAAYLSDGKVSFGKVNKFSSGEYYLASQFAASK